MYYLKKGVFFVRVSILTASSICSFPAIFRSSTKFKTCVITFFLTTAKFTIIKRFYDVHNLNITQANLLFHKNWKV